eukprot:CAMPEP_0116117580 /NCGR_PEP_ID=MMETSP0329-20121206/1647_1 /TAXON_ID=697910 /ORGANISM="Pseudo-nitzschia arenysensis, Strain B593" /LENGTH=234 /DNA_ID=CAMNT_0003611151 /DNA_START=121 /DNA_END=825 /DNA_ORIENTATION=-
MAKETKGLIAKAKKICKENYKTIAKETEGLIAKAAPVEDSGTEGEWKSDTFDCCKYGPCHKALLTAWCCTPIMLGQLLTRSKLTWLGEPTTSPAGYAHTFKTVLIVWFSVYIINSIFQCTPDFPDFEDGEIKMDGDEVVMVPGNCVDWEVNLVDWVNFVFWLYSFYCLILLRKIARAKYNIPEECGGNGDWVCALCCPCLTAVQIAHQTANYDSEEAYFFTPTGLSEDIEAIVV